MMASCAVEESGSLASSAAAGARIVASMWYCGDMECRCSQPRVVRLTTYDDGRPWFRTELLWEGTFYAGATADELDEQERELRAAAAAYGITLDRWLYGERWE